MNTKTTKGWLLEVAAVLLSTLTLFKHGFVKLLAISCLMLALLGNKAWAAGGGTPDPGDTPLLKAISVQIAAIDAQLLQLMAAGGGNPDPSGLPLLRERFEIVIYPSSKRSIR